MSRTPDQPRRLAKALQQPRSATRVLISLARGWLFKRIAQLRGKRFECGRDLRLEGKLILRGPGRVVLGDHVRIGSVVTPWTTTKDAVIRIGSRSFVNGASFGCAESIMIGEDCILGRSSIMDTDFHSTRIDRQSPAAPVRVLPIILEENVWVAAQAGILPGTRVGRNSVVGFGAICSGTYPPDSIIVGNPARVVGQVPGSDPVRSTPADPTSQR